MFSAAFLADEWNLLSAWYCLPPEQLRDHISRAYSVAHAMLASPDGKIDSGPQLNRVLASLAMKRYAGTPLSDAGWTVVAHAALDGDRLCQSLLSIELASVPMLSSHWLALLCPPRAAKKVDLRDRHFLRRRFRTKF